MNEHRGSGARAAAFVALVLAGALALAGCGGGTGAKGGAAAAQALSVKVTENGFEPAELAVVAGKPIRLTMTRETDQTCATAVVFASLKVKKLLPLNQPVTIDLPAQPKGRLDYACGMDMVKGALIVQ